MKKWLMRLTGLVCVVLGLAFYPIQAQASSLIGNPNITWSPDGEAFTTDAGERNYTTYLMGYTVHTGVGSSLRVPETGEHYYKTGRTGEIPVGKWVASYSPGRCIHNSYPPEDNPYYHGIDYGRNKCLGQYKTGWIGYCADCNDPIGILFYMDQETAASIKDLRSDDVYYYLCPHCKNLEQGAEITHECNEISWNQYFVVYNKNRGLGYIEDSTFMYNNATVYEGKEIIPETCLKKNTFEREGYEFVGWNTARDGSGQAFEDQEEILNLTSVEGEEITLYAQWKKSQSTLHIDPAGGSFDGNTGITSVTQGYGSTFDVSGDRVTAPAGNRVQFETNGGTPVDDIYTTRSFSYWQQSVVFHGILLDNIYTYKGRDGDEDTITAIYGAMPITLPDTSKPGVSFGGWYRDPECTSPVGVPGDQVIILEDTILYADWVDLKLTATDNYEAFNGSGAVDLSWFQAGSIQKTYSLFQSRDGVNWQKLSWQGEDENLSMSEKFEATNAQETYTVPYSGFYALTATGAQGEDWDTHSGGKGGSVTVTVWLSKGEVLTFDIGTRSGYNGGGTGSDFGNGGGMTSVSSDQKDLLMIAGGGGGASTQYDGGAGGIAQSVTDTSQGGNAGAGGGGGYRGGAGGKVILHGHKGAPQNGGGCYTKPNYHRHKGTAGQSYANGCYTYKFTSQKSCGGQYVLDPDGLGATCNNCGYYSKDCPGGYAHVWYETVYNLGCGKSTSSIDSYSLGCGMTPGQVESAEQAFGGSNYVNIAVCTLNEDQPGVGEGDGSLQITLTAAEYVDDVKLLDVAARDLAAPDPVDADTVVKTAAGENEIRLVWDQPTDYGTEYLHRAESYSALSGNKISDSNVTTNTLTSGIAGYYYIIDQEPETQADEQNSTFLSGNTLTATLTEDVQYLHLAAADIAGNLAETIHLQIGNQDADVAWKLQTDQLLIQGHHENIYAAPEEKTWYVRADGETPFTLEFTGSMEHQALKSYQINYLIFDSMAEETGICQKYNIFTPSVQSIIDGEIVSDMGDLEKSTSGSPIFQDAAYTVTTRKNQCRDLNVVQNFMLPAEFDAQIISVVPVAGAVQGEKIAYSVWEEDQRNGIRVIGDGTAPVVQGTEILEGLQEIDRDNGQVLLDLTCSDAGSGVKEFYVDVLNLDNLIAKTFYADAEGHIRMDLTNPDDYMFNGDFMLTIHAVDNVGNDSELIYSTCEFSLSASITRMREPHDPIFKRGETGILHITTTGYVDRVEVEAIHPLFPEGKIFTYTFPDIIKQEDVEFFIPLDAPEDAYTIIVRAYKNGQCLEAYPEMAVMDVNGTVLDEFRRKILWFK